jgi:hypothetical protein
MRNGSVKDIACYSHWATTASYKVCL